MPINPQPKSKTIRLKGKKYTEFRKNVALRSLWSCDDCGCYAPDFNLDGGFNKFKEGHVAHIKSRGSGGGDTMDNVKWKCFNCHRAEHDGRNK